MADFVTVLCRLPSGVTLELYDNAHLKARAASNAPIMQPPAAKNSVLLNGAKHDPRYHPTEGRLLGRAGRTQVDADFWNAWLKQNERNALVTQNLVFAEITAERADSAMTELAKEKTGLEGSDESTLPRDVTAVDKEGAS